MKSDCSKIRSICSWLLPTFFLIAIFGLLIAIFIPNFVHGGSSRLNAIVNNLRQIDAAKQEWAIEHGITNVSQMNRAVSEQDIAPFLLPRFTTNEDFGNPVFGELYSIRKLNQPCEAILTRKLTERHSDSSLPRGTIIRLDQEPESCGYELIAPDGKSTIFYSKHGSLTITNR